MRLGFEISHLKYATFVTVSRAVVLCISETDVGCMACTCSWIHEPANGNEKSRLTTVFNHYVPRTPEHLHATLQDLVSLSDIGMAQILYGFLEGLLIGQNAIRTQFSAYPCMGCWECLG
jgi:dynein heavy chain